MKIAILHDYFPTWGGAEKVVAALADLYPQASVYTAYHCPGLDYPPGLLKRLRSSGFFNHFGGPVAGGLLALLAPFYFEALDLREYEVIISSGYFSKGALTLPSQLHINYCHTPPRFLYHLPSSRDWSGWKGLFVSPYFAWLRVWDYVSAQRPDVLVSNSQTVQKRVKKWWGRDSTVIYPPVELPAESTLSREITLHTHPQKKAAASYFLCVSRLERYKNLDLVINTCNQLKLPLKIAGTGPLESELRSLAGPTVEVLGWVDQGRLTELYLGSRALIVAAGEEDFGITALEAQAYGRPVVALRSGGLRETIIEGRTGVFFEQPTVESLSDAVGRFEHLEFSPDECCANAGKYSRRRFEGEFRKLVEQSWSQHQANFGV